MIWLFGVQNYNIWARLPTLLSVFLINTIKLETTIVIFSTIIRNFARMMFHLLDTDIASPATLNNPFRYTPHPLTLLAARQLCDYLETQPQWSAEIAAGKMFGVLVCRDEQGRRGFLAAYSGQLAGRADWPWFVPAVLDYLQPDGHFRQEEARITAMNRQLDTLVASEEYRALVSEQQRVTADGEKAVNDYRQYMTACKQRRDALRADGHDEAALIGESQYQKAELRRIKKYWQEQADKVAIRLQPLNDQIEGLRRERHQRSDALQQWLFDHFILMNAQGERRSLTSIFADTPQRTPPSGAGECCAPKLLHHAFLHHLQPLCMGELWQGRSPQMEVRHHGQFYPACRGKCKPILEWMLRINADQVRGNPIEALTPVTVRTVRTPSPSGSDCQSERFGLDLPSVAGNTPLGPDSTSAQTLPPPFYEDHSIIVVSKPSGLLSVPGRQGWPSVQSILSERYEQEMFMPHRLDQDTSGLMVVARTMQAYHHLQRQFLQRTVHKEYEALLDGIVSNAEGIIDLPLRPDLDDRPRQLVDREHGKPAVTHYHTLSVENGRTRILLIPHTGRTHQLRVHCAHHDGLETPIVGDTLYGKADDATRLCLHARMLSFRHPETEKEMHFTAPTPF